MEKQKPMVKKKVEGLDAGLGSAVVGGGLFLFFWLVLNIPLEWSAVIGVVGYGAGWGILSALKAKAPDPEKPLDLDYLDLELATKTATQGRALASDLRGKADLLANNDPIRLKLHKLCDLIRAISDDVEADPKDASAAATFLGFQGQTALRMATMAIDLAKRGASPEQMAEIRPQMTKTMDRMLVAYEKHLAHLQEDNIAELQSEIEMLEESLDMEEWK